MNMKHSVAERGKGKEEEVRGRGAEGAGGGDRTVESQVTERTGEGLIKKNSWHPRCLF